MIEPLDLTGMQYAHAVEGDKVRVVFDETDPIEVPIERWFVSPLPAGVTKPHYTTRFVDESGQLGGSVMAYRNDAIFNFKMKLPDHPPSQISKSPAVQTPTPATPPNTAKFETFSARTFHGKEITRQRWLCKGLIPAGQPCLLSGDGGLGKSLIALQMAASVVSGRVWLSRSVEHGAALYVSCEDEGDEIHRRLEKITANLGVGFDDLSNLHIAPMAETDALLAVSGSGGLQMTPLWDALVKRVEEIRPTLVILDSLADVFGGNEINRGEVRWFIGQMRKLCHRTGATIVILSHPSLSGMATGSGLSGSTHWNNAVRSRLYLTKPDGAGDDERVLEVKKNNRGELGQRIELEWKDGVFIAFDGGDAKKLVEGDADAMFLKFLARYTEQGRYVNASGGTTYAPAAFEKEPEAKARRFKKRQFSEAMSRLFDVGKIAVGTRKSGGHERQFIEIVSR